MTEALKCPDCSAPLEYPADGRPAVQCSFCGSTVLLPTNQSQTIDIRASEFAGGLGSMVGKAMEMAQVAKLARGGNKLEAIRIYRKAFGADLSTAKTAVESLSAGRPVLLGNKLTGDVAVNATKATSTGMKVGCLLAVVIPLLIGTNLFLAFRPMVRKMPTAKAAIISALVQPHAAMANVPPPPPVWATLQNEFGAPGIGPGQFKDARSIARDGNGHLYVGEYSSGKVQVFDTEGKFLKSWSIGPNLSLSNLAASRNGTVYAVARAKIFCFEGVTGLPFGEAASTNGDDRALYKDVCAAPSGDLYAVAGSADIVVLDSEGHTKSIINADQKIGEKVLLERVVVNGDGIIYAMDLSGGIFKFAADGRYINRFGGGDSSDPASIQYGHNLAVDGQGRLYVSCNGPAVKVFNADGRFLDSFGGNEVAFGLVADDQDAIFACFRNRHSVRKYVPNVKPKN